MEDLETADLVEYGIKGPLTVEQVIDRIAKPKYEWRCLKVEWEGEFRILTLIDLPRYAPFHALTALEAGHWRFFRKTQSCSGACYRNWRTMGQCKSDRLCRCHRELPPCYDYPVCEYCRATNIAQGSSQ